MAYMTNQLISDSYYAAGIVSREFETVSGSQISDGLRWLNNIIAEKRIDNGMIPYETTYPFYANAGQKTYFIPGLIQIDTIVFFLQDIRYQMNYSKRNQFFGSFRVENITSLPFEWYFERAVGGGNLHIYFAPDQNYPIEIHGSFDLSPAKLGQDLTSNVTTANLGLPKVYGKPSEGFSLDVGQLVINSVDLNGDYFTIGALTNYINSGVIPGVTANFVVNDLVLSSQTHPPIPIYIKTNGYAPNGTRFIGNVAAATTANLTATYNNGSFGVGATLTAPAPAVLTIDGYAVQLNDRVLVKDQTIGYQNGSYIMTTLGTGGVAWVLTRTTNYDEAHQISIGDIFTVTNGTINAGSSFVQTEDINILGTTAVEFDYFTSLTFANFSTLESPNYEVFNTAGYDEFFTTYLHYALTDKICAEYNYGTPRDIMRQLNKYEAWIAKKSRLIDLEMKKVSTLQRRGGINWAFINIGKGFVPS